MANPNKAMSGSGPIAPVPLFNWGQERTDAALSLQKELLESYEQGSRAWFARVQSGGLTWRRN